MKNSNQTDFELTSKEAKDSCWCMGRVDVYSFALCCHLQMQLLSPPQLALLLGLVIRAIYHLLKSNSLSTSTILNTEKAKYYPSP